MLIMIREVIVDESVVARSLFAASLMADFPDIWVRLIGSESLSYADLLTLTTTIKHVCNSVGFDPTFQFRNDSAYVCWARDEDEGYLQTPMSA